MKEWATLRRRLMRHVTCPDGFDGCWIWQSTVQKGYGRLRGRDHDGDPGIYRRRVHRISYYLFTGSLPRDVQLDHLCHNRRCVNPAHLEPVSASENGRRAMKPGTAHGFSWRGGHRITTPHAQ